MFSSKAGAYSSGALFQGLYNMSIILELPANIRLGWKSSPGTNTLAYNEDWSITAVKRFITLGPGPNIYNFFVRNLLIFVIS